MNLLYPGRAQIYEVYEWKQLCYAELAAEAQHHGWSTEVCPVEVGCRGFVAASTTRLLEIWKSEARVSTKPLRQCQRQLREAASGCG